MIIYLVYKIEKIKKLIMKMKFNNKIKNKQMTKDNNLIFKFYKETILLIIKFKFQFIVKKRSTTVQIPGQE
jgi:hypothetical protein